MQENTDSLSENDKNLRSLKNMGYPVEEAAIAMERCGTDFENFLTYYCINHCVLVDFELGWKEVFGPLYSILRSCLMDFASNRLSISVVHLIGQVP